MALAAVAGGATPAMPITSALAAQAIAVRRHERVIHCEIFIRDPPSGVELKAAGVSGTVHPPAAVGVRYRALSSLSICIVSVTPRRRRLQRWESAAPAKRDARHG